MSKIHNLKIPLLTMSTAVNTNQTGHVFQLFPGVDSTQDYKVFVVLEQSETQPANSNTPNTATVHLEHSPDNVNYIQLMDPVATNSDGTEVLLSGSVELLKFVRVRTELGGSAHPKHKATVSLLGNRAFAAKDLSTSAKVVAQ